MGGLTENNLFSKIAIAKPPAAPTNNDIDLSMGWRHKTRTTNTTTCVRERYRKTKTTIQRFTITFYIMIFGSVVLCRSTESFERQADAQTGVAGPVVQERARGHRQPIAEPLFPQTVDQAVRAGGRSEHGRVGQDAEGQSGDDVRLLTVHHGHRSRLQRFVDVAIVRQFRVPRHRVQLAADQIVGAGVPGHHGRLERGRRQPFVVETAVFVTEIEVIENHFSTDQQLPTTDVQSLKSKSLIDFFETKI